MSEPGGEHDAEIVQLRQRDPGEPDGAAQPDLLPAVREEQPPAVRGVVYQDITRVPGERLPIIPEHLRGRRNIEATIRLKGGEQWHRARWHGARSPVYLLAALWWAVIGLFTLAGRQLAWWWAIDLSYLMGQSVAAGDERAALRLHKEAKATRRFRGYILLGEAVVLLAGGSVAVRLAPWWAWPCAGAVALPLLARLGRPDGKPIIGTAIIPPDYSPPTTGIITDALASLGIANINAAIKDGRGIQFVSEVMRDGPGWGCQLDLPRGVTAGHIIARRSELASGLRRPLSATWPEAVPSEHEGRLSLWVGFHDISKQKAPRHPLAKAGTADIFASVPFGTDPRLRPVGVPLFEVNYLIGASPGQGKTATVRNVATAAALDVACDLWIHEQAGKGDLEPFAQVCHRYCSGLDDEAVAYAAESARMLRAELERRSALFKKLPKEQRPDGKLTREMAMRHHELRPIVAIFDEAQVMFLHPAFGLPAAGDLAHVMRLARAYGIIIIISTQRPDKDSVPTAISGVVTGRFCLKVPDYLSNDLVLGTGAYKAGYNAAIFRLKTDAGLGWLKADGAPQIVRTYYLDLPASEKIAARARAMRDRAGVLTGYALGLDDEAEARDVLADVLAVFGDAPGLHWDELADRLAGRWPDRWADATGEAVSAQCRTLGVPSVGVKMAGVTLKGCRRVAVEREAGR
jgi:DNA segregation ATPase FtsK/SpoIIIE, S-DNA-T family